MTTSFPSSLDNFTNPTATDRLNTVTVPHHQQHTDANDAIEAVEAKVGIDFSSTTNTIDYAINQIFAIINEHSIAGYKEILPASAPFPTSVTWYTDSGKTIKLVDKTYTYDGDTRITSIVYKLYDKTVSNNIVRTVTDTIAYSGASPFETSRTRTVT